MIEDRSMVQIFSVIPDPRKQNHSQNKHKLIDVLVMAICAVVGGANTWVEVELFCRYHHDWFKKILGLEINIPSHDTFGRIFALLDSKEFETVFRNWVSETYHGRKEERIYRLRSPSKALKEK